MPLSNLQRVGVAGIRAFARMFVRRIRLQTEGMHNVPETGPVVLAARHYHQVYDGIALLSILPRPVHLVISVDWARNYVHRVALHGLAYVAAWPVLLRSERVIQSADEPTAPRCVFQPEEVQSYRRICLQQCDDLLCDDRIVAMFPEGYPNIDSHDSPKTRPDEFLPFRAGFVWIAQAAAQRLGHPIPVVPVGFVYHQEERWSAVMRIGSPYQVAPSSETDVVVAEIESRVRALCVPS